LPRLRRAKALFLASLLCCLFAPSAGAAETCPQPQSEAAIVPTGRVSGIAATLAARAYPDVQSGSVAAWVGATTPSGNGWIRAGLRVRPGGGIELFSSRKRPGRSARFRVHERFAGLGERHRVVLSRVRAASSRWRLVVDGAAVVRDFRLRLPLDRRLLAVNVESRDFGPKPCNVLAFTIRRVRAARAGRWRDVVAPRVLSDRDFLVERTAPKVFVVTRQRTDPTPTYPVGSPRADQFAIAAGGAIQWLSLTDLRRELDGYRAVGARWLRFDVSWAEIQAAGKTSYNWWRTDAVVQEARARGLNVLGTISYTPAWARTAAMAGTKFSAPADPNDYAAFAAQAVRRYAPQGVRHWEIWNEPNLNYFWQPVPDVAAYGRLLQAAYVAIKGEDPEALVVSGGLAPAHDDGTGRIAPAAFVEGLYQNGTGAYFDALGFHPYAGSVSPHTEWAGSGWYMMARAVPSVRDVMVAHGDAHKRIWGTEYGLPTNGPAGSWVVSEDVQAQRVLEAYGVWSLYDWTGPLFWYRFRDRGTTTDTIENFFGLLRYDFSPKPAYAAYQQLAASASS
jgi:polysaccharide biosynthesis protein PslG